MIEIIFLPFFPAFPAVLLHFFSVPELITSQQVTSSSAPSNITILVGVNGGCTGREGLRINVTVIRANGAVLSLTQINVTNSSIIPVMLGSVPPGVHNCSIFIMQGTRTLDAVNISCQNSGMYVLLMLMLL